MQRSHPPCGGPCQSVRGPSPSCSPTEMLPHERKSPAHMLPVIATGIQCPPRSGMLPLLRTCTRTPPSLLTLARSIHTRYRPPGLAILNEPDLLPRSILPSSAPTSSPPWSGISTPPPPSPPLPPLPPPPVLPSCSGATPKPR